MNEPEQYKRKFQAFVGDRHIKLLEENGILSIGRGSKGSEWVRNLIDLEFNKIPTLERKCRCLQEISLERDSLLSNVGILDSKIEALKEEIEALKKDEFEEKEKTEKEEEEEETASIKSKLKQDLKIEFSKLRKLVELKKITQEQLFDVYDIKNDAERLEDARKLNIIYYI